MRNDVKIGLALSGGGVKGVAHIGVLKALEEAQIFPDSISGTSAGALVGALYASGKSPDDIFEIFDKSVIFSFSNMALGKPGFIDLLKFKPYFQQYFPEKTFASLERPLFVAATDLVQGKTKIFKSGDVVDAVLASSAFPLVFSPYTINGKLYADGGIVNNFPIEPLLKDCDYIIGVYANPLKHIESNQLKNTLHIMDRVYQIATRYASLQKIEECHHILLPQQLEQYGTFEMKKAKEIYELGYAETKKHINTIVSEIEELKSSKRT